MIHCDKCKKVFTHEDGGCTSTRVQVAYREGDVAQATTNMPGIHDLCSDCWDLLVDVDLLKLWLETNAEGHERMSDEALTDLQNNVARVFEEFVKLAFSAPLPDSAAPSWRAFGSDSRRRRDELIRTHARMALRFALPNEERLC